MARLMNGEKAALCFTSPPYAQQRDYEGEAKEPIEDWDNLMRGVFGNLPMGDEGQVLVNLGPIHRDGEWIPYWQEWIEWMRSQGWRRFGWYVWDKGSGLPGDWSGRLAPSHEFIWHFNRAAVRPRKHIPTSPDSQVRRAPTVGFRKQGGTQPAASPDKLGQDHKIPDSVIRIGRSSPKEGHMHPATFPPALALFILRCWPGAVIDPFLGSGSTMIAAEQLGRRCFGMEIEPRYVDVAVRRWEDFTGRKAVRCQT